jgi:putative DNA primase/helicase
VESRLKAAHKPKSPDDVAFVGAELIAKRQELHALTATEPRYSTSDATTEKLGELLLQNQNGLLLHRDELVGWLKTLEKPGREGDRQFYLEAWSGTNPFHVDRIGRGSIYIPALCISIIGTAQPGPLRSYVREACSDGSGADGLLQRVQLLIWPDEFPDWQCVDISPNAAAKVRACDAFQRLSMLGVSELGAEADREGLSFVRFNDSAQERAAASTRNRNARHSQQAVDAPGSQA